MPNRHAPHSHIAGDPKPHKPCSQCGTKIQLQHTRQPHDCSEQCTVYEHSYAHEPIKPVVRYFDGAYQEICEDCVKRQYGADKIILTDDTIIVNNGEADS